MSIRYLEGPCQKHGRHHHWQWSGKHWTCGRCGCIAFDLKWADNPCLSCGHKVEDDFGYFCDRCLDAGTDIEGDYVPFELEVNNHDR